MFYNSRGNLNIISDSSTGFYSVDGSVRVTVVDGTTWTGLIAPDGSTYVIVVTGSDMTTKGLYHPCGAWRVVPADTETGLYAPNGAYYVDEGDLEDIELWTADNDLISADSTDRTADGGFA